MPVTLLACPCQQRNKDCLRYTNHKQARGNIMATKQQLRSKLIKRIAEREQDRNEQRNDETTCVACGLYCPNCTAFEYAKQQRKSAKGKRYGKSKANVWNVWKVGKRYVAFNCWFNNGLLARLWYTASIQQQQNSNPNSAVNCRTSKALLTQRGNIMLTTYQDALQQLGFVVTGILNACLVAFAIGLVCIVAVSFVRFIRN